MAGSKSDRLQEVLVAWRSAEREHAKAVLRSNHPELIQKLADDEERALREVRLFIDSEPWEDMKSGR